MVKTRYYVKYDLLFIESITADELTNEACRGDFIVGVALVDEVENFNYGAHLVIAILLGSHCQKKREDVALKNGKLVEGGAVKDNVCVFLEGEYPPFLASPYRVPHIEGTLYRCASALVVAHDSAKQS